MFGVKEIMVCSLKLPIKCCCWVIFTLLNFTSVMVAMMSTKFGVMLYTRDHTVAEVGGTQERCKVFYSTLTGNPSKAFKPSELLSVLHWCYYWQNYTLGEQSIITNWFLIFSFFNLTGPPYWTSKLVFQPNVKARDIQILCISRHMTTKQINQKTRIGYLSLKITHWRSFPEIEQQEERTVITLQTW